MEGLLHTRSEYVDQTSMTFWGALILVFLVVYVIRTDRQNLFFPFVLLSLFISQGQRISIAGIDFSLIRILTLVAFLRILGKNELKFFESSPLDFPFFAWMVSSVVVFFLRERTSASLIFSVGRAVDNILLYIVFRTAFDTKEDLFEQMRKYSLLLIPVFLFFLLERFTGRNIFAYFGGVPAITVVRAGRLRCQGSFAHPIIGGVFIAGFLPLLYIAWRTESIKKSVYMAGMILTFGIVYLTASSTPVISLGLFFMGMLMTLFIRHRSLFFPGIVLMLIALSFVMEAPVYHLISRIDLTGGSTGWHRYFLIHQAVLHFREWVFLGISTTGQWGGVLFDITNQYILEGIRGGFISLGFFLATIVTAFRLIGGALSQKPVKDDAILYWYLGVAMLQHVMNFFAVSYFGEATTLLLLHLALIGSLIPKKKKLTAATSHQPVST